MADALQLRNLSVTLSGKPVLKSLNLEIPTAKLFGILGPNGAGKTTLLKALAGLVTYQGEITHRDQSLAALGAKGHAQLVAYVPQRSELSAALNVYDVVAQGRYCHQDDLQGPSASDKDAIESALIATKIVELAALPFTQLSGGEQRRVLLARALATQAPLILLDEPAASLDVAHALSLFKHMRALVAQGRTVIVVLHDINDAKAWCDSLALLSQGSVVATGAFNTVITAQNVRSVYGVELIETSALGFRQIQGAP
ncbi:MAG TPA: ABC transporter ATP-binding protein [Polyangiaceae bacterium]|nr:ABC transporter ATP-binding protein [Polyangiaceae bacterium]